MVISSDEDEPTSSSQNKKAPTKSPTKKTKPTTATGNVVKPNLKKLKSDHPKAKPVNISDIFGSEPAVQKPIETSIKPKVEPDPLEEELDASILDDLDCSVFEDTTAKSSNKVVKIESPDLTEKSAKNEGKSRESPAKTLPEPKVASARKRKPTKSSGSAGEHSAGKYIYSIQRSILVR